ncbi:hypothetical protein GQ457_02G032150 [Hibiscus cannabinus]
MAGSSDGGVRRRGKVVRRLGPGQNWVSTEVILKILERLPVKSLVRFRSICKSWNSVICDPCFISTHLQSSLSNNAPFLLLGGVKKGRDKYSLNYDKDGFDRFKQLQLPVFSWASDSPVIGSCNGLSCVQMFTYEFEYYDLNFLLWNPSIQKYVSLPQLSFSEAEDLNVGFGFDSRTNDYKLLVVGVDKDYRSIQPYLFSLNENCWKRVNANSPSYAFGPKDMTFVNGALHSLGNQERNDDEYSHAILGFDLSAESFFEINLPESLVGLCPVDLSIMNYGESSIAVSIDPLRGQLHELWVMKEYGVVESWTKVLTLDGFQLCACIPSVLGFRKNGEVLLRVRKVKMASLDLNSQQMGASLQLNCQQIDLHGVDVGADLLSVCSFVESLVLLDVEVDFPSESDVDHYIDSSDLEEMSGAEADDPKEPCRKRKVIIFKTVLNPVKAVTVASDNETLLHICRLMNCTKSQIGGMLKDKKAASGNAFGMPKKYLSASKALSIAQLLA